MLLKEITSQIIKLASGGVLTDESRYDFSDIDSRIHLARASVIQSYYNKIKRIGSDWIQTYIADFDRNLQDSTSYVRFSSPRGIPLDTYMDGYLFVGDKDGLSSYRRANNRAVLVNYYSHRNSRPKETKPTFIYSEGYIEVYGNPLIKELRIDGIFANPLEIKTFNEDIDSYPISNDLIDLVKDFVLKTSLSVESSKPADFVSNSKDSIVK